MNQKQEFILRFQELQPKFPRLCAHYLSEADLTLPQFVLLNLLVDGKPIPMTEVSEKLHITKPAVTNLVDRLEQHQWIKRLAHPSDRRVYLIQIQPKGEKIVRNLQKILLKPILKTLECLSDPERETVSLFYAALSKTLDEEFSFSKEKKS